MSIFFQIPTAMLNSIWLMSILFILYQIVSRIFKFNPSRSFVAAVAAETIATVHFLTSIFSLNQTSFKFTSFNIPSNLLELQWLPYIGIIYCLAFAGYFLYLFKNYKHLSYLRNTADFKQSDFWNQAMKSFNIDQYTIGYSSEISTPIVFGWADKIILLPISILNQLSTEEVKYILLHEVAHIIRNDFIIQILVKCFHGILLFNPFSYFFLQEINIQRELACDKWVINKMNNPLAYSKSLYQLAAISSTKNNALILNAIGSKKDLLTRVKFIHQLPIINVQLYKKVLPAFILLLITSIGFIKGSEHSSKTSVQVGKSFILPLKKVPNSNTVFTAKKRRIPLPILITTLSASVNKSEPIKEEQYTAIVSKAANWIKAREDQYQFVNYSKTKDSLEFDITEKLLLRSLLQNYQLRKELLNAKLATINSEKEAMDYLNSSKEWKEVLQYENWAGAYLKKHPEISITDSLRRF